MILQVKHKQLFGQGAYGLYFKLKPTLGVKIVSKSFRKTPSEVVSNLTSQDLNRVVQEATIGKIFDEKFTKGLCIVKYNKRYYLGILLKHEQSITAIKYAEKYEIPLKLVSNKVFVSKEDKISTNVKEVDSKVKNKSLHLWMKKELWKKKIIRTDENKDNILVKSDNSLRIVDFDSEFNHFHGSKAQYYAIKKKLIRDFKSQNKKLIKKGKKG